MAGKRNPKVKQSAPKAPPAPVNETIEQHMRRIGCFNPGEIEVLLKVNISHEHIDQLAMDKEVATFEVSSSDGEIKAISENHGGGSGGGGGGKPKP